MTSPSDPLITPADLGVYLSDTSIDPDRAAMFIQDAQTLCEAIVSPLPDAASVIVKRVAGRAYVSTLSARAAQQAAAGSPYGAGSSMGGGVWLSDSDLVDLRRLSNAGGGAFSIDLLPADYAPVLPPWGTGVYPDLYDGSGPL